MEEKNRKANRKKTMVLLKILQLVLFLCNNPRLYDTTFWICYSVYLLWFCAHVWKMPRPNKGSLFHSLLLSLVCPQTAYGNEVCIIIATYSPEIWKCSKHTTRTFYIAVVSTAHSLVILVLIHTSAGEISLHNLVFLSIHMIAH